VPVLRRVDSTTTVEVERCQLARAHEHSGISLCSFFVAGSQPIVLGQRYRLDLEDEALLVVPIESIQREIRWTQILAVIVEGP